MTTTTMKSYSSPHLPGTIPPSSARTRHTHTHTHTHAVPADFSSPRTNSLGVGAAVPAEFRARGAGVDTLRRNLLGLAGRKPTRPMPAAEKSPATRKTRPVRDESDEETGRSALGGPCSKRRRTSTDPSRKPARVSAIVAVKTREKMKVGEQQVEVVAEVEGGPKVGAQSEANLEEGDDEVKPKLTGDADTPAISASSPAASASDASSAARNPSSKKSKKKNKRRADGTAAKS